MVLKNKYVVGCLVQFYEVEMFSEYIDSCVQMIEGIENPENVLFHFGLNFQEYFESIEDNEDDIRKGFVDPGRSIRKRMELQIGRLTELNCGVRYETLTNLIPFYNIAKYRRQLNSNFCEDYNYVLWGETDSLWPKQTLEIIELLSEQVEPKHIISFASRVNWDSSWDITRHPLFELEKFQDNDEWVLNNEASEKAYMTLERMNEINDIPLEQIDVLELGEPKADGSCLIISSELIKSGVNIPHSLLHCGEDESFLRMAKIVMGNNFRQYLVKNILRVHNRRHPKKRMYIKNEDNPRGFCDDRKGDWWKRLENASKYNLENLRNQIKFNRIEDVIGNI